MAPEQIGKASQRLREADFPLRGSRRSLQSSDVFRIDGSKCQATKVLAVSQAVVGVTNMVRHRARQPGITYYNVARKGPCLFHFLVFRVLHREPNSSEC